MLFTSYEFIGFLAILFLLYYIVPKRFQWGLLLAASYIFYACASPSYLAYILVTSVTIYLASLRIQKLADEQKAYIAANKETLSKEEKKIYKQKQKHRQSIAMVLCVLFNFAILAGVKYTNFFIGNVNSIMHTFGSDAALGFVKLALPMGISFYTLQAVGYIVDVYHGTVEAEKNFFKFALFISFFPQLIQGPISRFGDLSKTLYGPHDYDRQQFFFGLQRILWGFFKKLVIADRVFAGVGTIIGDSATYNGAYAFVGMFLYTLQLYADFTGGIDVTIGVAQALGIVVRENFDRPYFSKTLKEYWRRWHITMCEWFRTYVFYAVSTSKKIQNFSKFSRKHFGDNVGKKLPVYLSSFVVWFATGIWHGASWNFIVWGLLNWFILMVAEEVEPACDKFHAKTHWKDKWGFQLFQMLRTFLLVCILNLFDCYVSVGETLRTLASIVTVHNWGIFADGSLLAIGLSVSDYIVIAVGIVIMFSVSLLQNNGSVREQLAAKPFVCRALVWGTMLVVIIVFGTYGIGYDSSQFIYNRF